MTVQALFGLSVLMSFLAFGIVARLYILPRVRNQFGTIDARPGFQTIDLVAHLNVVLTFQGIEPLIFDTRTSRLQPLSIVRPNVSSTFIMKLVAIQSSRSGRPASKRTSKPLHWTECAPLFPQGIPFSARLFFPTFDHADID